MFAVPRAPERHGARRTEEERGGVESRGVELSGKERGGVARIRAGEGIRSAALGRRMRQRAAHPDLLQHQFVRSWMVDLARKNRCWRRSGHAPVFCAASGRSPTGRAASRVCVCVCVRGIGRTPNPDVGFFSQRGPPDGSTTSPGPAFRPGSSSDDRQRRQ